MEQNLDILQEAIGYQFRDVSLLKHALTHPSYSNESGEPKEASNQRLEFLGMLCWSWFPACFFLTAVR